MGLSIERLPRGGDPAAVAFVTPVALCLDETKEQVVPCDSTEARWLLAGADCQVSVADATRYGLSLSKATALTPPTSEPEPEPEPEAETKMQRPVEDKAAPASAPASKRRPRRRGRS